MPDCVADLGDVVGYYHPGDHAAGEVDKINAAGFCGSDPTAKME
jgi:hypothetical protein